MIILTNCLAAYADEGILKVAVSLVGRIKHRDPRTTVVSCGGPSEMADLHLPMNRLFLNRQWLKLLRQKQEPVLYIPFGSNTSASVLRLWILSRFAKQGLKVLFVLQRPMSAVAKALLKSSGAQVLSLSPQAHRYYREVAGPRAEYIKTGVDTKKFCPVSPERKAVLREKYGIPAEKKVVLHVGHMKASRNVGCLLELGEQWHGVLAVSTQTTGTLDMQLRDELREKANVTLFETYLPHIEELYQLADVYLFPVTQAGNCIDVPLSALEAASCGIPVAATPYGELTELLDKPGFYPIESLEPAALDSLLAQAAQEGKSPRESVLDYHWDIAADHLLL